MGTQKDRELIYESAIAYLEFCGNDISSKSFEHFCTIYCADMTKIMTNKIFLCAIALIIDEEF